MKSLQFITHSNDRYDYLTGARLALEGGCRWIQLRMKQAEDEEFIKVGKAIRELCHQYKATFILDDRVHLVELIEADGVHLGQKDMPIDEARELLGEDKIIGGTANTIGEIERHAKMGANYIGCGPFRFTTTKNNLAPLLGLEGYKNLIAEMNIRNIALPLIAIGGITLEDIADIKAVGVAGIAISSAILDATDPTAMTEEFINQLNS